MVLLRLKVVVQLLDFRPLLGQLLFLLEQSCAFRRDFLLPRAELSRFGILIGKLHLEVGSQLLDLGGPRISAVESLLELIFATLQFALPIRELALLLVQLVPPLVEFRQAELEILQQGFLALAGLGLTVFPLLLSLVQLGPSLRQLLRLLLEFGGLVRENRIAIVDFQPILVQLIGQSLELLG